MRAWRVGKSGILWVGLLLLGGLLGTVGVAHRAQAAPVVYGLDPGRSTLVVQLFKAGLGAVFAHDHVVRASRFAGEIQGDPADPTTATITITVEATALQADEPAVRSQYGLTQALDEQDRQAIQATMTGPGQLDVARYPTIRFQSTRVTPRTAGQYMVSGALTIHGVTQPVTVPVQAEVRHDLLHAWGQFRFRQSRFGYAPYSAFFGAVRNQDEVVLHFDLVATPSPPAP